MTEPSPRSAAQDYSIGIAVALVLAATVAVVWLVRTGNSTETAISPTPLPSRQVASPSVVVDERGSGTKVLKAFTVTSAAEVKYRYNCAGAGGIFQIFVEGGSAVMLANTQEIRGADSSYLNEPGTYALTVNTTCNWQLRVLA